MPLKKLDPENVQAYVDDVVVKENPSPPQVANELVARLREDVHSS
jgi:hypothetical protein